MEKRWLLNKRDEMNLTEDMTDAETTESNIALKS